MAATNDSDRLKVVLLTEIMSRFSSKFWLEQVWQMRNNEPSLNSDLWLPVEAEHLK